MERLITYDGDLRPKEVRVDCPSGLSTVSLVLKMPEVEVTCSRCSTRFFYDPLGNRVLLRNISDCSKITLVES